MSIYLVTWKTSAIGGCYTEGRISAERDINTKDELASAVKHWEDHVKETVKDIIGGEVIITGVFKV